MPFLRKAQFLPQLYGHSALKLKKVQFQKCKKTLFAFSKMAKKSIFAPEKSLELPKMKF